MTMYLEYDWTFNCYRPRFGRNFISIRDVFSYETLADAKQHLALCQLALGKKTDSRTWEIVFAN
jgi:hypothetical protein